MVTWKDRADSGDGLFAIACAIDDLATQVKYLGGGNNASQMGAIEFLAVHLGQSIDDLGRSADMSSSIDRLSETIDRIFDRFAEAIEARDGKC